ncbi:hypothetical protein [Streptomyces sp. NRRL S-37]|uniref:hypothetical protein n=1 Tax=Streptomyces sp. NRRL S-37 TaxID=1463903 RepID=UPI0004C4C124|nr:hypothetical protein [Streptomyces sp. NRRL S-37]
MKSPAELDTVPWQTLAHAYGPAVDVPDLIRALHQDDDTAVDEAVRELYGNIHHQGTVYSASAPAVPFLAHAALHVPGRRAELLMLLATLADHTPSDTGSPHWPLSPVAEVCTELCRVLPDLLPCLTDTERPVRRAALRVVAAVADVLPAGLWASVEERVGELYAGDAVPAVRADALVVLNQRGREPLPFDSPWSEVRMAAATLAAERSGPPYPAELVTILAEDGAEPDPGEDDFPWPGTDTPESHLTGLLTDDPDAALAVAARWIDAGDLGSRGSWLAREITESWRDREPEVLDLLLAALPHQRGARSLVHTLDVIGRWVGRLPEPGDELRDTLYDYARTDGETARPALLALVRSRDPRAVDVLLRRPDAKAVRAAATVFPEAGDELTAVIREELSAGATGNAAAALIAALEPLGTPARQARPELVECLRTRRAAVAAARQLGLDGILTGGISSALREAGQSSDASLRAAAAVAHYRLTGDAVPALRTFEELLSAAQGPTHWHLGSLQPLGGAAAPLLPLVEPMLTSRYEWTRATAAEAHHWITGSPADAVPVLAELAGPSPVGLHALKALAVIGRTPEGLRPALRACAFSPRRLLGATPFSEDHEDEELRAVAWSLLTLA